MAPAASEPAALKTTCDGKSFEEAAPGIDVTKGAQLGRLLVTAQGCKRDFPSALAGLGIEIRPVLWLRK
jgi:hypothetical protein